MQQPSLGRIVLVKTPFCVGGQVEHAAMITRTYASPDQEAVDVRVIPAGDGETFPMVKIFPEDHVNATKMTWRWPPKV